MSTPTPTPFIDDQLAGIEERDRDAQEHPQDAGPGHQARQDRHVLVEALRAERADHAETKAQWNRDLCDLRDRLAAVERERNRCEFCHAEEGAAHNPLDDGGVECPVRRWAHQGVDLAAAEATRDRLRAVVEEVREMVSAAMDGLVSDAQEIRNDWSEFDGRSNLRDVYARCSGLAEALARCDAVLKEGKEGCSRAGGNDHGE